MSVKTRPDYLVLISTAALLLFGAVTLASVTAPQSLENFGNSYQYLKHQLLFGLMVGAGIGFLCYKIPLSFFKKWAAPLFFLNIACLLLVFLPHIGVKSGGAARWLNLRLFFFQPSELLKITFLCYLAAWLAKGAPLLKKRGIMLLAFFVILGVLTLILILQRDMSTLMIIALTGVMMYFAAGKPLSHIVYLVLLGGAAVAALIKITPYRVQRFIAFLNPETAPLGIGYQIHQAFIAIGSGKIFGVAGGLGWGKQKFGFLPHAMTDSIFAIIGEEAGLIGCATVVLLLLLFAWRGFKIARTSKDWFNKLLAVGITGWIVLQSFFNIGSMLGILPIAGIPLPFISYGSSHLIAELIGVGLLLNISKSCNL